MRDRLFFRHDELERVHEWQGRRFGESVVLQFRRQIFFGEESGGRDIRRELFFRETEEAAYRDVERNGGRGDGEETGLPRHTTARPATFHRDNPIGEVERFDSTESESDIGEQAGESIRVSSGAKMPLGFLEAGDEAKKIFDGHREKHLPVGLYLRKIDEEVRFERLINQREIGIVAAFSFASFGKVCDFQAETLDDGHEAAGEERLFLGNGAGAVSDGDSCSGIGKEFRHCGNHGGVGGDGLSGVEGAQEIGLEKNRVASGAGEEAGVSEAGFYLGDAVICLFYD